ncbi:competence protein ComGF [Lactococcus hircilactis]|uniref:Competence protein ComGF n=1 Tax=Lactococcus hircilactis TaxID=1494462 RepID=A0A7X2D1C1_9LACT|nr:competence protein ComGF [Lactococcus hircilactis]
MKKKIRAFSLIETLLALFVISESVLVIFGLTKVLHAQIMTQALNSSKDWQIFCEQMRSELDGTQFVKVENNALFVSADKGIRYCFVSDDFRKTDDSGRGYQPMLYQIKGAQISETQQLVEVKVEFKTGGVRTFLYNFAQKNK